MALASRSNRRRTSVGGGPTATASTRLLWIGLLVTACGDATRSPDAAVTVTPTAALADPAAGTPREGESGPVVLVAFYSETGMTRRLAEAVAEGVREVRGARAILAATDSVEANDLRAADAIVLGSPTHWANMATGMRRFIDSWPATGVSVRDRIGAAFATGGGNSGGKEFVVTSMLLAMLNHGMIVVGPVFRDGDIEYGNFGVAAPTGLTASQSLEPVDLDAARALGRRVAEVAAARPLR